MLHIILALIIVAATAYAAYFVRLILNARKGNFPPTPKEDSFLGHLSFFKRMPTTLHQVLFEEMKDNYGPLVHLRLVNQHIYIISDPQLINQVLKGDYYHYPRPCLTLTIGKFAILSVEGEVWKRHRKIISSCLTRERVKGYVDDVITKTDVFVDKLRQADEGQADFARLITTLTVEVFVKAVYNYDMNLFEKPDDKLFKAIEDSLVLSKELPYEEFPALWWITHPFLMRRFTNGKNYVNAYLEKLIAQYRDPNCVVDRTNLVATLIDSCDKEGIKLSADEIRDETFIMFYAGFETTFATILWTLYHLSKHPEEQAKVQKELDEVLGDGKAIEYEQLTELKYLNGAIKETLRITPVAVATCRQAIENHTLGGFDVPKDSVMILNFYGLHHDKNYWEDASSFKVDRWVDKEYKDLQLMYLPFGGGKRACAGIKFAEMELRIMLAKMLQSFTFSAYKEPKSEQILTWVIREMELSYKPRELPIVTNSL